MAVIDFAQYGDVAAARLREGPRSDPNNFRNLTRLPRPVAPVPPKADTKPPRTRLTAHPRKLIGVPARGAASSSASPPTSAARASAASSTASPTAPALAPRLHGGAGPAHGPRRRHRPGRQRQPRLRRRSPSRSGAVSWLQLM